MLVYQRVDFMICMFQKEKGAVNWHDYDDISQYFA